MDECEEPKSWAGGALQGALKPLWRENDRHGAVNASLRGGEQRQSAAKTSPALGDSERAQGAEYRHQRHFGASMLKCEGLR